MTYHDPDLFFVVYLAYVNMFILNQKYFEPIPEMMDQGILKNIFLTNIYQIPKNFPEKLKTVIEYLFRTANFVDISFEIIPPLFKIDGSTVSTYLIREIQIMSIWKTKPLEKKFNPKIFITFEKQDFIS